MDVTLICGPKRQKLSVDPNWSLQQLKAKIEDIFKINEIDQTLICKGVTIQNENDKLLSGLNIRNGSKVMVIGRRHDEKEQRCLKVLKEIRKTADVESNQCENLKTQLESLMKGFITDECQDKAFKDIKKRICTCSHKLMKTLESVDEIILDESYKDARLERKTLVNNIQKYLDISESMLEELKDH